MKVSNISFLATLLCLMMNITSCTQETDDISTITSQEGITLTAVCNSMLPQVMMTRANEQFVAKEAEEKQINTLHLFFFDADGNFLQATDESIMKPYHWIKVEEGKPASLTIPENAFKNQESLTNVQIYAVANVFGDRFVTQWTNETASSIRYGDRTDPKKVVKIEKLADLQGWYYRPTLRDDISKLPIPGMPMVGLTQNVDLRKRQSGQQEPIKIQMQALMARVDITVELDANQTNHQQTLPRLQLTEYGVRNMPTSVPFTPVAEGGTTWIEDGPEDEDNASIRRLKTVEYKGGYLYDKQSSETFSYYTYENVQQPTKDPVYPSGVNKDDESVTQRWKRTIANKNASAVVLKGIYTTHQELTYEADFNIYMGSNTYNNFEVHRNCCYKNNITIHGLDYVRNSDDTRYTFDGRVNVKTGDNNTLYLSLVNERKVDAHASVLPMDVYFLRREEGITNLESYVDVTLVNPETGETPDWIRMELIDSLTMENGKTGDDYITGGKFAAGTGSRKYFYTDLLTNDLKDATSIHISGPNHKSRSRIYFYIDENVTPNAQEEIPDRTVTVYVTYNNKNGDKRERTLEIDQKGLLHVKGTHRNGSEVDMYIEYYEEYLAHNDPLDQHEMPAALYDGLPWGFENKAFGVSYSNFVFIRGYENDQNRQNYSATENFIHGYEATKSAMGLDAAPDESSVLLYNTTIPHSAFHYCYGKNKRDRDGKVPDGRSGYWELPAITDLEYALVQYYSTFSDFQGKYYWSACAGSGEGGAVERTGYARATKVTVDATGNYTYASSGDTGWDYPDYGGYAKRSEPLRIRAAYKIH